FPKAGASWGDSARGVGLVLVAAGLMAALAAHATARHLFVPALLCWAAAAAALVRLLPGPVWPATITVGLITWDAFRYRADSPACREFVADVPEDQAAIARLDAYELTAGYGDYWSAYPITYLTGERITVAPSLPTLWGGPFDRYPEYPEAVRQAPRPFFLIERRCVSLPALEAQLAASGQPFASEETGRWQLIVPESDAAAQLLQAYAAAPMPC